MVSLFLRILNGSFQGVAERPLRCNYNVILRIRALFTAATINLSGSAETAEQSQNRS
jgi:hypothetical protein